MFRELNVTINKEQKNVLLTGAKTDFLEPCIDTSYRSRVIKQTSTAYLKRWYAIMRPGAYMDA